MEEEGIGLVLARATELRFRISNCIHRATDPAAPLEDDKKHEDEGDYHEADYGEEAERLLNICDALEALESQLSSLQAMQQNHKYEREEALAEIEYSRKMLLDKLKEYKGEELEVIQEASAFAGDTVEHNTDLLLPPYPSRPPLHLSSFSSPRKSIRNGMISSDLSSELKKNVDELEKNQSRSRLRNQGARLGQLFGAAAKSVVTLVGVLSLLSLAGLGSGRKSNGPFKDLGMILGSIGRRSEQGVQCPSGKVLVMEDGQPRCLVKERVEVPFESVVTTPDVNYGCG